MKPAITKTTRTVEEVTVHLKIGDFVLFTAFGGSTPRLGHVVRTREGVVVAILNDGNRWSGTVANDVAPLSEGDISVILEGATDINILTPEEVLSELAKMWGLDKPTKPVETPKAEEKRPKLWLRTEYLEDIRLIHPTDDGVDSYCLDLVGIAGGSATLQRPTYKIHNLRPAGLNLRICHRNNDPLWECGWVQGDDLFAIDRTGVGKWEHGGSNNISANYTEIDLAKVAKSLGIDNIYCEPVGAQNLSC